LPLSKALERGRGGVSGPSGELREAFASREEGRDCFPTRNRCITGKERRRRTSIVRVRESFKESETCRALGHNLLFVASVAQTGRGQGELSEEAPGRGRKRKDGNTFYISDSEPTAIG